MKICLFIAIGLLITGHLVAQEESMAELPVFQAQPVQADWLLSRGVYRAAVYRTADDQCLIMSNGLVARRFRLTPTVATLAFDNLMTGASIIRGVKPEGEVVIDGDTFPVGGLRGQPNYAFFRPEWENQLTGIPRALPLIDYSIDREIPSFAWKRARYHDPNAVWPPGGVSLHFRFALPGRGEVGIHYALYDDIPVMAKWMTVTNTSEGPFTLNAVVTEQLAAVEYASWVENSIPYPLPHLHVETDYAFSGMTADNANRHVIHWEPDPDYATQVNYQRQTPCLLRVSPELGPAVRLAPGETFESYRTYELAYDSYDRERMGLARRRLYRVIAPWTTENPLMMHVRYADWETVKNAVDQCAALGFEMLILTFGSGFNIEDESPGYLAEMGRFAAYARSKGIEIGGYSLLASRQIGEDQDVVLPEGQTPTFGHSPCLQSEWGRDYFRKLYQFFQKTGFSLLEHDGSYPGDPCGSTGHPGHLGWDDSRWQQFTLIRDFYRWCRQEGIFLNVPDYYFLAGSNKTGMGYREVNWSLPRDQQLIHTRQNIFDGTWEKTPSMGWMFVPLTEYHGGGPAATIEPLHEHLDHYEQMLFSNLSAGVQACYRGPRLFDVDTTKNMVKNWVDWYKQHREVLEGEIIHLRRADGRDIDYWLNINPFGEEKGMLVVFNPLDVPVSRTLRIPLYYTGLLGSARITGPDGVVRKKTLDRDYAIEWEVAVPARGFSWYLIQGD